MTRPELADAITRSPTGRARRLFCDEERIRRWEAGEVHWPSANYRKALQEVTQRDPQELGFLPPRKQNGGAVVAADTLQTEHELFGTMELARLLDGADIGIGTLDALEEATDLLCRSYPKTPSSVLKVRIKAAPPGPLAPPTRRTASAPLRFPLRRRKRRSSWRDMRTPGGRQ
jgi:hypothetical protein